MSCFRITPSPLIGVACFLFVIIPLEYRLASFFPSLFTVIVSQFVNFHLSTVFAWVLDFC